jgi:hypothetical protein
MKLVGGVGEREKERTSADDQDDEGGCVEEVAHLVERDRMESKWRSRCGCSVHRVVGV